MAEGWARTLKSELIDSYSAGIEKHGLNPNAVSVMREAGVDITSQASNTVEELGPIAFDFVVTVCGHANENCPVFLGPARVVHFGFDDPPKLAKTLNSESEILNCYRRVRDEIKGFIETLPESLDKDSPTETNIH